ncbi:hypothetical protein Gohar_013527 [Gossypium harknessii]|uniref:Uncharacterized protein n=1 Tax=Gossypium harknessii TaxID=34285 RepID=A0A7J9H0C4_9ROSI|nr:hypothetical protein [Gossypium harknessii]
MLVLSPTFVSTKMILLFLATALRRFVRCSILSRRLKSNR